MKFASLSHFYFSALTAAAAPAGVNAKSSFNSDIIEHDGGGGGGLRQRGLGVPLNLGNIGICNGDQPCGR
jgi:hypothetical protein